MKKLIVFLFVVSICSVVFAVNKNVVYDKDTNEIEGVQISTKTATEAGKIDIVCENNKILYGYTPAKLSIVSVDEKSIPVDITTTQYKIDAGKKEIYLEVILGDKWKDYGRLLQYYFYQQ